MFRLFSGLRIGARLSGAFLLVAVIGGAIGAFGVWGLSRINELNDRLYDTELRGISDLKEANLNLIYAGRARSGYLAASSEQDRQALKKQFDEAVKTMDVLREKAAQNFHEEEGKRLLAQFVETEQVWKRESEAFFAAAQSQSLTQTDPRVAEIEKRVIASSQKLDDLMTDLAVGKEKAAAQSVDAGTDLYGTVRLVMIILAIAGVVIGMLLGWLVTRGIVRPLEQAVKAARQVAAGDLTTDIQVATRDETGDLMTALKAMNESLARIVADVRDGCESIASASSQIAQGNSDLSQRTEEQASSLEETAASMEELTSTVQQNANNASEADRLVTQASSVAVRGGEVVEGVVQTMSAISDSSRRIADITGVIDGIAFQTNILALNAAVEAARAGEQGRGFAVVAGEVRTLAQRSAVAAKEIKALIDESATRVQGGTRQVDEAGRTMREVVDSVRQVAILVREIASASEEQSSGIGQVNQAVAQMDTVTQQNAALVEEAAAAAASMQEQAGRLAQEVRRFKVDAGAGSARGAEPRLVQPASVAARKPVAAAPRAGLARPALAHASDDDWSSF
ncbi:chemotaxis protein [Achromobacter piechaudii]|uniref:Methyl-accepting chemotaxis protein III n=2 Tax=Achromobacter piechaudii TaxID=72556 RepID=A0ABM8KX64_9BURK|nr:methyl-accepting chemotaxis protein [Achromobacter piechaudii]EFF74499.1 methyl-accepting chemotaxis protein signaling domain protein [Achromobacter piechaudii ATCC 43553]KNY08994.1 chemotaxis protein [Achromobacter piechaudii]CAB3697794.1 Methyl-accepting chemotaxis protein III [Achromobacter piechaudii]CAB3854828.1 Methyl-accepting chemotaxis protein III [Achromobacter piechaudii]CAB3950423.1 Methyl-accepting chemotaxis protein III [Achromobacter piechaudii]